MTLPNDTANLMGYADKFMVDHVYGKYVEGLELDTEDIKAYFGEDFWHVGN